jgi:hypothetical protein
MMEFRCRLTSADIATLTVSLGMHTVGDEKLGTTNDAQMTRRVSRVIMHNGYYIINNKPVSVMYNSVIFEDFFFLFFSRLCLYPYKCNKIFKNHYILNQSFIISEVRHIFHFVPF